ncbi:MAG: DUF4381 family protein [Pseudomonadota bacterium]|jgi:hypothetical protein
MPPAIPTPFDIIDPAPDALVPSAVAWLILVLLAALAYLAILLFNKRPARRSARYLVGRTLEELKSAADSNQSSLNSERIARLSRRILTTYLKRDIGALSPSELENLATELRQSEKSNEMLQSASIILELIGQLEDATYAPASDTSTDTEQPRLIQRIITALETHIRRFSPE